ncbi:MAG: dTDP-4-dehydrorhamnose reductase [Methylococcales bacterium]|nr:dTDP-4-dehydrorhamnose reductase [Methylococcales bacterium]
MKILLIGREGQLAWELHRSLACLGEVVALDRHSQPLAIDLSDVDSIRHAITQVRPQLIINAAAYTAVDKAEQEPELAQLVNGVAPGILAELASEFSCGLIHYSTDYVFDGEADEPYCESAKTSPTGIYGVSKRAGEQAIIQYDIPHLILRTSWVYGSRGSNFLLTMLRLMRERETISVVSDQIGAPTWSRQIAECTALMVMQCSHSKGVFQPGERSGIYNLSCDGETSWFGFADKIKTLAFKRGLLDSNSATVLPIPGSEYPTPAKRPDYSVLAHDKLEAVFALRLPDWQLALQHCLADDPF